MILRRLTEHLKQQNWTAVGIELVILVLGVFIGMQVSNWNEERAEARLGREYVQRLIHDLNQDHDAVNADTAYYSDVLRSVLETDKLLAATDPDPRALVVNAYRATEITYTTTARATWDQIVSSGHLELLPAGAVETNLSLYYAFDNGRDIYSQGLDSAYRRTVRRIIPLAAQEAIRAGCSDIRDERNNVVGFAKECSLDIDPADLKEVAAALRSDPAVAADLRYQYSFVVSAVLNLGSVGISLEDKLAALGAEPQAEGNASP